VHIAFLTVEYPPLPSGGIGTSIRNLARALVRHGHRVSVVGWGHDAEFEDGGVQVRFLRRRPGLPKTGWFANRRLVQRALASLVASHGVQIVEAHDWCGVSAGVSVGCPVVVRCNGSATYFAHLLDERVRPSVFGAEWLALRAAADVVAVSRFTATTTRRLFCRRAPMATIPNGIDLSLFPPGAADAMEPELVLYLGTLQRKKGVIDVCRIFSRIVERRPDARLRLVGRDSVDARTGVPSTWALCQRALSSAARARTEYLGEQPYDAVHRHVAESAVCLFPSFAEALPLSWLEAMATARAIVAYDIGWASEVVEPGTSGLLAPRGDVEAAADACVALLEDPARAGRMGLEARRRVEALFSDEIVARRSAAWYDEVLRGWRGARGRRPGMNGPVTHP
jgi:glycosyltransferase involved in cell wall biosynthesis